MGTCIVFKLSDAVFMECQTVNLNEIFFLNLSGICGLVRRSILPNRSNNHWLLLAVEICLLAMPSPDYVEGDSYLASWDD
jgi:hypothetical protein